MKPQVSLYNLHQFDNLLLTPALARLQSSRRPALRNYAFCEVTAAYFWLDLGVSVGYFPVEPSSSLVLQRFPAVGESVESFLQSYSELFPDEWLTRFQSPVILGGKLSGVRSGTEHLAGFVRGALGPEYRVTNDDLVSLFQAAFNFDFPAIEEVISRDITTEYGGHQLGPLLVEAGFQGSLQQIQDLIAISKSLLSDASQASIEMDRTIRHLSRWRVNRIGYQSDDHFLAVAEYVWRRQVPDADIGTMLMSLASTLQQWGNVPHFAPPATWTAAG